MYLSLTTELKRLNIKNKNPYLVYRNEFYNICIKILNCRNFLKCNRQCENLEVEKTVFNCSEEKANELSQSDTLIKPKYVVETKLPLDTQVSLFRHAHCKSKKIELEKKNKLNFLTASDVRIRIINGFVPIKDPKLQFFENGEDVFSFAPLGNKLALPFAINQLNLSMKILKKSLELGSPNPNSMIVSRIDLFNEDLKIERVGMYIEQIIPQIFHQVFYVCAKGKDWAYHFTIDRSARDPTHEKGTAIKAITNLIENKMLKTLIRVTYYNKSFDCTSDLQTPENPKFSPKLKLVAQGDDTTLDEYDNYFGQENTHKFVPKKPVLVSVHKDRTSFSKLFTAIQRYALRHPYYTPNNNCQHFATGFYNYLTGKNVKYINHYLMSYLGVSTEPFKNFFKDETDEEYAIKISQPWDNSNGSEIDDSGLMVDQMNKPLDGLITKPSSKKISDPFDNYVSQIGDSGIGKGPQKKKFDGLIAKIPGRK